MEDREVGRKERGEEERQEEGEGKEGGRKKRGARESGFQKAKQERGEKMGGNEEKKEGNSLVPSHYLVALKWGQESWLLIRQIQKAPSYRIQRSIATKWVA